MSDAPVVLAGTVDSLLSSFEAGEEGLDALLRDTSGAAGDAIRQLAGDNADAADDAYLRLLRGLQLSHEAPAARAAQAAVLCLIHGRGTSTKPAAALLTIAQAELPETATGSLRALVALAAIAVLEQGFDGAALATAAIASIPLLPDDSPAKAEMLVRVSWRLAMLGELGRLRTLLSLPAAGEVEAWPEELQQAAAIDALGRGDLAAAAALLAAAPLSPDNSLACTAKHALHLLQSFDLDTEPDAIDPAEAPLLAPVAALQRGELAQVGHFARELSPAAQIDHLDLLSWTPLRLSLSCGDRTSAERLWELRRQLGYRHFLDGLFEARLHLLSARSALAADCFQRSLAQARQLQATGRFYWELQLALELRPADYLQLATAAANPVSAPATRDAAPAWIGSHPQIVAAAELVQASGWLPRVICGEAGTGRRLLARQLLAGRGGDTSAIGCLDAAGLDRDELDLWLTSTHAGLVLSNIELATPAVQAQLLQVFEHRTFVSPGSNLAREATQLVICTASDLDRLAPDLRGALSMQRLDLPALRQRADDLIALARHRWHRHWQRSQPLPESLLQALQPSPWPGNVRELFAWIDRLQALWPADSRRPPPETVLALIPQAAVEAAT